MLLKKIQTVLKWFKILFEEDKNLNSKKFFLYLIFFNFTTKKPIYLNI